MSNYLPDFLLQDLSHHFGKLLNILDSHKISSEDPVGGLKSALCPHENTYDLNAFPFQVLYLLGRVFHCNLIRVFSVFVKCTFCCDPVILRAAIGEDEQ